MLATRSLPSRVKRAVWLARAKLFTPPAPAGMSITMRIDGMTMKPEPACTFTTMKPWPPGMSIRISPCAVSQDICISPG